MRFSDRVEGGRQLAQRLAHLRGQPVVVLGLPRGGVPVAAEVARALGAPLDVIVVRKLGLPFRPELAMGAIGEGGVVVLDDDLIQQAGVTPGELAAVEAHERQELDRRARRFRGTRRREPLAGRTAVIVDDGVATGSTARAACRVARALGAARVVLATPVAPTDWTARLAGEADELVAAQTPTPFLAVGQFYADFDPTTDEEVVRLLDEAAASTGREVEVPGATPLPGRLTVPGRPRGTVVFAHGSGSSRHSPRNQRVAEALQRVGLATLLFDLLTDAEARDRATVFDVELLARRLNRAMAWLRTEPTVASLPIGCFGASTGAAAALWASTEPGAEVAAIVSRGGRPDLAGARLAAVTAPTLLLVGGDDHAVLELNREAAARLRCEHRLVVVPGATHLFDEPGTLEAVAAAAGDWFSTYLSEAAPARVPRTRPDRG